MDFILVISLLSLIISICIACALICIYKFLVGLVECIYNIQQPHHIQLDDVQVKETTYIIELDDVQVKETTYIIEE